jgi:L-alanine-DL-glutamate epimerase-like enolase superfamily enzyme
MKIIDFRTTIVSVPFTEPETWAFGKRLGISNVIIELETDTGLIGLGEGMTFPAVRITAEALQTMRPLVLGRDPFDHEVIVHELTHVYGWHHFRHTGNCALGGIDMALWDLVGQACGQPLYKLFGGAFRKEIPFYFYLPDKDLKLMAADAQRGLAEGFTTFYLKLGRGFDRDLEIARTVREALGGNAKLRVDANEAWANGTAIELMKRMAKYDIEFFEQPLAYYDHDGAVHLRRTLGLPVAANQSAWNEADIVEIVKKGAADVVLTDQHQLGSLARFRRAAWLLATAGIPVVKHTFGEFGISTSAGMHAIATCPNFTMANQTHLTVLTDDIVEGGLAKFHHGCLTLPEGPGLGVKLDRARLAIYARCFEENGEFSGYGTGEDLARRPTHRESVSAGG